MMKWINRLISRRMRDRAEAKAWEAAPLGCCSCGTGGPHYFGTDSPLVRYLYAGVMAGAPANAKKDMDWSACSRHPLRSERPVVDLGTDMVLTYAEAEEIFKVAVDRG